MGTPTKTTDAAATATTTAATTASDPFVIHSHVRPLDRRLSSRAARTQLFLYRVEATLFLLAASALRSDRLMEHTDDMLDQLWRRVFRTVNAALIVEGRESFDGRSAIIMSNGASLVDGAALLGAVPGRLRMAVDGDVADAWTFRGPHVRRVAEQAGFAAARSQPRSATHVWLTSRAEHAHVAARLGAPIVPAAIDGSDAIMPRGASRLAPGGTVRVRFGRSIETADRVVDDVLREAREAIASLQHDLISTR